MGDRRQGAVFASRAVAILRPHGQNALLADALVTLAVCEVDLDDPAKAPEVVAMLQAASRDISERLGCSRFPLDTQA